MRYLGALRYFLLNSCELEKNGEVYYLTRIKLLGSFWKSLISMDWEWGWINFWREISVNLFNNPRDKLWWEVEIRWNETFCYVLYFLQWILCLISCMWMVWWRGHALCTCYWVSLCPFVLFLFLNLFLPWIWCIYYGESHVLFSVWICWFCFGCTMVDVVYVWHVYMVIDVGIDAW